MKFSIILLGAALYLFSSAEAGISTDTPFKSVTWNGGEDVQVKWSDDGKTPALTAILGLTTVDLMAGNSSKQVFVDSIGQAAATDKEISYTVPKDVGPPGDFYFIKYTAGDYSSFSGQFSIANVNGKIDGFDPNAADTNPSPVPASATPTPATPSVTPTASNPSTATPKTGDSAAAAKNPGASPGSSSNASNGGSAPNGTTKSLPSEISAATKLLSRLSGVASAAVGLTFIYLY